MRMGTKCFWAGNAHTLDIVDLVVVRFCACAVVLDSATSLSWTMIKNLVMLAGLSRRVGARECNDGKFNAR